MEVILQVPQLVVDDLMAECAQLISEELPSNLSDARKFSRIPVLSLSVRLALSFLVAARL